MVNFTHFHTFLVSRRAILPFLFVLRLLAGKAKAALKGAAISVLQQLHKHAFTPADSSDIQR